MRWPKLVLPFTQSMPVEVVIELDGIDEDGAPIEGLRWEGPCNWQDSTEEKFDRAKSETQIRARLYFDGDPFESLSVIAGGTVAVMGEERSIVQGMKARNPDATVNYTRLDLR